MFDLIFADPPYFLSNNGITCQNGQMVSVNKGEWDKAATFEEIHAFNLQWLRECRRLLKPDGAIWVSGTSHNIFSVGYALQTLGFKVLNDIAWYKVNPPPNLACRYFTHATETVIWARRSPKSRHVFHYDAMKRDNGNKQMQSLWHIKPPAKSEKRYGKHPTQKPEALLDRILRASTNPGDLILDPFCGSGTTGVLCARLGRRFVGIEREIDYLQLAKRRIEQEIIAPRLFSCAHQQWIIAAPWQKHSQSWRVLVENALYDLGGEAHLKQIYRALEHHPRTRDCPTWPCTIRRTIREGRNFIALGFGNYKLAAIR